MKNSKNSTARPTTLNLDVRRANSAYFQKSGIRKGGKLTQRPFVVFRRNENGINTEIVDNVESLIKLPARTRVMAQWEGKNRSDYVQFTVAQLREFVQANPPQANEVI